MEAFKTPNLQAPRFRTDTYQVLNKEFFLNLWKRNKLVFIKEDGENDTQAT